MRHQRRPAADLRSTLPRRARSLEDNNLGPDGARALAPALEKMVGLKELTCAANAPWQPALAQAIHRRARSLSSNELGPDGARALVPVLEKMVGLKELKCAGNAARQPTPAQTSPAAVADSGTTASGRTGCVRLHRRSRIWSD